MVQTLQLSSDRDPRDLTGDLSVCLDGMQVDPEVFASAERERGKKPLVEPSFSLLFILRVCLAGKSTFFFINSFLNFC